ncbi:MAG: M20/M25/M40 family metallo-hydrolase [Candidatus Bathyarchaeota archaeon]|nr:M20/M25/M40 family metallo-hydrolase [Candidatus Bathyarchaeota archaeon]
MQTERDLSRMECIELLKQLIRFPTFQVTPEKVAPGMKDCALFLSNYLESLGFDVKIDELFNVTAERSFEGRNSFLINTHYDTVSPASQWNEALDPISTGNRLYGLGASDAKGGIAATLYALSQIRESRFAKVIVQFMNYEDNSIEYKGTRWLGTPYFLTNNSAFTVNYGINVEPTVIDDKWTVGTGCTGRVSFTVKTLGKEAHSSNPRLGRNAIYDMAKVIEAIRRIPPGKLETDDFQAEMPINVAMIKGGRAINIVPGDCEIACERRIFPNERAQEISETIRSSLDELEEVEVQLDFNPRVQLPYIVNKSDEVVSLVTGSVVRTVGYKPDLRIQRGRTDSVYLYHKAGIKTAIIGPGHMGHSPGEYINVDRLIEFTKMLGVMLEKEA